MAALVAGVQKQEFMKVQKYGKEFRKVRESDVKEDKKRLLFRLFNFIIISVEAACFAYVWYRYYADTLVLPYFRRGNWAVIGMYVLIVFFFTKTFNGYKLGQYNNYDICLSHSLALFFTLIVEFFEVCLIEHDYIDPRPLIVMYFVQLVVVILFINLFGHLLKKLCPPYKTLVVYGDHDIEILLNKLKMRKDQFDIGEKVHYSRGIESLTYRLKGYEAVLLCDLPAEARNEYVKFCYEHSIRTYIPPKISDILLDSSEELHLFDTRLLLSEGLGITIEQRIVKRFFDILLSLIAILLILPFGLIISAAIKLYDGGPVFFKQERLTRDGKVFRMIKFRSMKVNAEETTGAMLALKEDDRITPVGRFLRRFHLDELPQVINILKGEMSFVGPRPERKVLHDEIVKEMPEFDYRLKVKAGLTGYAQVYGKYSSYTYDKLKYDLTYIENYSLWLDFKLMILTVKILFIKENSEGVDQ